MLFSISWEPQSLRELGAKKEAEWEATNQFIWLTRTLAHTPRTLESPSQLPKINTNKEEKRAKKIKKSQQGSQMTAERWTKNKIKASYFYELLSSSSVQRQSSDNKKHSHWYFYGPGFPQLGNMFFICICLGRYAFIQLFTPGYTQVRVCVCVGFSHDDDAIAFAAAVALCCCRCCCCHCRSSNSAAATATASAAPAPAPAPLGQLTTELLLPLLLLCGFVYLRKKHLQPETEPG